MSSPSPTTTTTATATAATTTIATTPVFISSTTLDKTLTHKTLVTHFQTHLPNATHSLSTPPRHSLSTSPSSTLLLMPSFPTPTTTPPPLPYIGVKIVTSHPNNSSTLNLPGIHATYALFNSLTGQPLALFDATDLTLFRTSSISALASFYLSNLNCETLVLVGSGNLSAHLVKAHLSTRPSIKRVFVWNRTRERAVSLVGKLREGYFGNLGDVGFEFVDDLDVVIGLGDIVCCATGSDVALVKGERLKCGAHLDLVGSFKPSMMECDDVAVSRGRVFVDNVVALDEAGELVGAFERGVIKREDICGCLVDLIKGDVIGRKCETEITVFKSVGSGVVDLLTAQLVYETLRKD